MTRDIALFSLGVLFGMGVCVLAADKWIRGCVG